MTKALIRKIKKIDNYRIFQNWKPSGSIEFARLNLIYGQNGSGKSTLASLLAGCAANATADSDSRDRNTDEANAGLQLLVTDETRKGSLTISLDDREFWTRVHVFNKDFVNKNLRFGEPDGPQPEALLTIGERLTKAEEQLKSLRPERDKIKDSIPELEEKVKSTKKTIDKRLSDVAKQVVDDLRTSPVRRYRATNTYTKRHVREVLEDNSSDLTDASTDLAADRKRATRQAMRPIDLQHRNTLLEQDALNDARKLLAESVLSNTHIRELVGRSDRSRWVQEGIALHEHLEECLFCGQPLTSARVKDLNAHFDKSFKKLQSAIDGLVKHLEDSEASSKAYLNAFPGRSDVYEDLQDDLQSSRTTYEAEHKAYAEVIHSIVAALKEKRENPFSIPALSSELALTPPSIVALDSIIDMHQTKIEHHDTEAAEAAKRVEHYHVSNFLDEYDQLKQDLKNQTEQRDKQKTRVEDLERKIATLEDEDGDPVPGADELTKGLRALLGRDELTFSASASKRYVIQRSGAPATHLSEGEQTAIALLYFLASVREDKIAGDPPIVVIDDPVSSLDHGILFGASARIWSELVLNPYASQVFLMTHSFDLFRHWLVQLEGRNQHEGCDYKAYEMVPDYAQRGPDRFCRVTSLRRWETDQDRGKVLRSEYHYLFSRVAHSVTDRRRDENPADQMNELALMPNAARRMLEAFLSFRCPGSIGSFQVAMDQLMDSAVDLEDSVRKCVVQYLHTYSHFNGGDISQGLSLTEAKTVLRSLFQLMDHVDHDHVSAMCTALDIDQPKLLNLPASATSAGVSHD